MDYLEGLWGRPRAQFLPDLLPYLRHEVISTLEPVLVGAKVLIGMYDLPAGPRAWLGECAGAAEAWTLGCGQVSDASIQQTADLANQCELFLKEIGALLADSAGLLESRPSLAAEGPEREEVEQIFGAVQRGLARLAQASTEIGRGDYTWLKRMFDETERKRRGAR